MSATAVARLAALLADPTRARLCLALLDGRAWTAGELAAEAGVAASTASAHLDRLVQGGLLVQERQGRHRYLRLAGPREGALLEQLLDHVGPPPPGTGSLRAVRASSELRAGRTCYDHLAGRLGVAVTDAMLDRHLLTEALTPTAAGARWFDDLGAALPEVARRPSGRPCLDWTERRPHLAGVAGAMLCAAAFDRGWVRRTGTPRAARLTASGRRALQDLLGVGSADLEV